MPTPWWPSIASDGERPVVVAHSFGGFTGALACSRVDAAALIYVSAMVPRPGEAPGDWWDATGVQSRPSVPPQSPAATTQTT